MLLRKMFTYSIHIYMHLFDTTHTARAITSHTIDRYKDETFETAGTSYFSIFSRSLVYIGKLSLYEYK